MAVVDKSNTLNRTSEEYIASLEKSNCNLVNEVTKLKERVSWFERQMFGQKSEKTLVIN